MNEHKENAVEETTDLTVIVEESGLEPAKAQVLLDNFSDYFQLAADWETKARAIVVSNESQEAEMKMAREGRLFLRKKRIDVENTRKKLKEQSLREGKAIDGIANVLKALIVPIEEYLDEQEHFAENKRKAEEEARRQEAEKLLREKEERERLEREAEERRIREENERLKKEAEEREKQAQAEREAAAKAQREAEEKARKEREAIEAKARAEREKAERERKAAEEKARKEQEAAEAKARAEREAAIAEERKKAAAEAKRVRKEAEAKARKEREAYEAKMAEERRLAAMVTCPKCGHTWSTEDE